jgi:hypothetical protein
MDSHRNTKADVERIEQRAARNQQLVFGQSAIKQVIMANVTVVCDEGQPQKTPPLSKPNWNP